jgi:hypothetical protein
MDVLIKAMNGTIADGCELQDDNKVSGNICQIFNHKSARLCTGQSSLEEVLVLLSASQF